MNHSLNSAFKVAVAPPGTQAAQIDIKSAYRCIPTSYKHLPHLVVSLPGEHATDVHVFIDRVHPFGLRSSGGNLGYALDASVDILTCTYPVIAFWAKWVDDLVPIRHPKSDGSFDIKFSDILKLLDFLGWPLSTEKLRDFASQARYIGFIWDFDAKCVKLPEEKRLKFLDRVSSWLHLASSTGVTVEQTQKVLGTLVHVANIHTIGRSFMLSTQRFLSRLDATATKHSEKSRRFLRVKPPSAAINDMRVWLELLGIMNATRSLIIHPLINPDVWVDASSEWGIAIVIGRNWRAWKLAEGWKSDGRDIGWAESVALELAVYHLIWAGYSHVLLLIHSDNQGAIGQYNKGRGSNQPTNDCIRRLALTLFHQPFIAH